MTNTTDFDTIETGSKERCSRRDALHRSASWNASPCSASHTEPQRGVSEANCRIAAALRPEMSAHTGVTPYRSAPLVPKG